MIPEAHLDVALELWSERRQRTICAITGNSMSPMIRHGDALVIEHGAREARTGDIIVFRTPAAILAHRVVGRAGRESYLAKGDACSAFDEPVRADQILGKVVEIRGAQGSVHLTSAYWRTAGFALAMLSRASGRPGIDSALFWRATRFPVALKRAMLPAGISLRELALRLLRRADIGSTNSKAANPNHREVN